MYRVTVDKKEKKNVCIFSNTKPQTVIHFTGKSTIKQMNGVQSINLNAPALVGTRFKIIATCESRSTNIQRILNKANECKC